MVRGEVYVVRLEPRSGSEQQGARPCVLVSHDSFNCIEAWGSLTVVPITSSPRWLRASRTSVALGAGEAGLGRDCAAIAHQVTTVDRSKLVLPPLGRLSRERMEELERALRNYLDLGA